MLDALGCSNVQHYKSGTETYPKCLNQALIAILSANLDTPVLILEDDVIFTGNAEFDYVEDADAIYFGLSKCAGHPTENKNEGNAKFTPYSMSQVRVQNMLAAHAILYISRRYKEAIIDLLQSNMDKVWEMDVLISRIQSKFKILANMKPMFYQSAELNPGTFVERLTNIHVGYIVGFGQHPPPKETIYSL
jgi:GR25 family glycosyltransferase involved in LPS biosynthesis